MFVFYSSTKFLASIARKVYIRQGNGVGSLKDVYGGSEDRGVCPSHHRASSGKIIRVIFHQLEKAKIIERRQTFVSPNISNIS